MRIRLTMEGDVAIVAPSAGLVGGNETLELEKVIQGLIEKGNERIVLDMAQVNSLTTRPLAVIVSAHVNYSKRKGRLVICNPLPGIARVFRITRLDTILAFADSVEDACKSFQ